MLRFLMAFSAIISIGAAAAWSSDSESVGKGTFGVGYDEGLQVRVIVLDEKPWFVSAYANFGFFIKGADSVYHQPLNQVSWKLGGEYVFKKYEKLNFGAFGEWREEMLQDETGRAIGGNTLRYNQWNTTFRIGVRPEWFILDRLSIDYKIGIQYTKFGSSFRLNAAGNDTQSNDDDYSAFGAYSGRSPFSNKTSVLMNFGVTFYIGKLIFFN